MDRVGPRDLIGMPDPDTDLRLLPLHLRGDANDSQLIVYHVALRMAMEQFLSQQQRDALHMRYWLGKSIPRIGAEMGVTASAVSKRIASAQAILRDRVGFCVRVYDMVERRANPENY